MLELVTMGIIWAGIVAYAVFGGADFGSGVWDLLAGSAREGAAARTRIDHSIGPVWEANHVWLIFVLVYLWTGFPQAFAAIVTDLYLPLIGASLGIVLRGAAFVYRKSSSSHTQAQFFGVVFASSSVVTPFFFGACVGAVASGRVTLDADADIWEVWINPTSFLGGVLAVGTCAWLAAVFLASDAARDGDTELARVFGRRAIYTGMVLGAVSLAGILPLLADAPTLASRLERGGAPFVAASALGGLGGMWLIWTERYALARPAAVLAVVAILAGWAVGQYPWLLVDDVEIVDAAGASSTLWALLAVFGLAAVTAVPALVWLFQITDRGHLSSTTARPDSSQAILDRRSKG